MNYLPSTTIPRSKSHSFEATSVGAGTPFGITRGIAEPGRVSDVRGGPSTSRIPPKPRALTTKGPGRPEKARGSMRADSGHFSGIVRVVAGAWFGQTTCPQTSRAGNTSCPPAALKHRHASALTLFFASLRFWIRVQGSRSVSTGTGHLQVARTGFGCSVVRSEP